MRDEPAEALLVKGGPGQVGQERRGEERRGEKRREEKRRGQNRSGQASSGQDRREGQADILDDTHLQYLRQWSPARGGGEGWGWSRGWNHVPRNDQLNPVSIQSSNKRNKVLLWLLSC
jgi:hypothetical protein